MLPIGSVGMLSMVVAAQHYVTHGGKRILRHVQRILIAHVDDRSAELDLLRARANGGEERERRAELACEVVYAEVCAVCAECFGGHGEIDRLQERIAR